MTDAESDRLPPLERLRAIMRRLRDPETGCPWDVKQSFATIAPYTIEEAYEVAEAIRHDDMPALKDELGDLLLQVVFHARMAEEAGHFDLDDVAGAINEKMLRRHPHVFGAQQAATPDAVTASWEEIKAAERAGKAGGRPLSALDGVTLGQPALSRAVKLQKRAATVGFDWPEIGQVLDKLDEELGELRAEIDAPERDRRRLGEELGDLLFVVANLARHLKIDPEAALRDGNAKFERRFRMIEDGLAAAGRTPAEATLEEMEALWVAAKRKEREIPE